MTASGALARKELLGATRCLEEFDARRQHSEGMRLVKATYRKPRKLETGLRRKPRLDMVGRSHEENLMPTVAQLIGNGKRRIDMAGGSTGRNDEIHGRLPSNVARSVPHTKGSWQSRASRQAVSAYTQSCVFSPDRHIRFAATIPHRAYPRSSPFEPSEVPLFASKQHASPMP